LLVPVLNVYAIVRPPSMGGSAHRNVMRVGGRGVFKKRVYTGGN
jgi:hypothetical protein